MNLDEYQRLAIRTKNPNLSYGMSLLNDSMGLAGEAAEAMEHIKKVMFHGHTLNVPLLKKELGDVLWYLAVTANDIGLGLDEIAADNITKLRERYPEGFSAERSINRKENNHGPRD